MLRKITLLFCSIQVILLLSSALVGLSTLSLLTPDNYELISSVDFDAYLDEYVTDLGIEKELREQLPIHEFLDPMINATLHYLVDEKITSIDHVIYLEPIMLKYVSTLDTCEDGIDVSLDCKPNILTDKALVDLIIQSYALPQEITLDMIIDISILEEIKNGLMTLHKIIFGAFILALLNLLCILIVLKSHLYALIRWIDADLFIVGALLYGAGVYSKEIIQSLYIPSFLPAQRILPLVFAQMQLFGLVLFILGGTIMFFAFFVWFFDKE